MSSPAGEDLWHIFNLVREGDQVTATTFRKVQAGMSGTEVDRVKLKLTVTVEAVDFDPEGTYLFLIPASLIKKKTFSRSLDVLHPRHGCWCVRVCLQQSLLNHHGLAQGRKLGSVAAILRTQSISSWVPIIR